MNKRQQQQYAAFFQQIYEAQQIFDFIKQKLAGSRHYNPNLLFDLISAREEKITIQQMKVYLVDKVVVNEREIYEIIERFDWSRQGFISREDFLREIQPFGSNHQFNAVHYGTVTAQIEGHFLSLIVEILKRFRIIEVARKQIKYIQPYDAFQYIDYLKIGHIGIRQLRKLLFDNDFNVTDKQLYYLFHGLRRRCYRQINLECFCENLNPLQNGQYAAYQYQIDKQKQKELRSQNRHEEETMRRSRLQSQRIQHQVQKSERKKQAELDRQMELQKEMNKEIVRYEEEKQRQIRKALMQQDRNIRHRIVALQEDLKLQILRNQQDVAENQYLNFRREQEESLNFALAQSVQRREQELSNSRRALQEEKNRFFTLERQTLKQIENLTERQLQNSKRSVNHSNAKVQTFGKISNQSRKIQQTSRKTPNQTEQALKPQTLQHNPGTLRKKYQYDLSADIADIENSKVFESSRTRQQTHRKIQRQSRRIQEQSRRRYLENTIKSKYQKQLQMSNIRPQLSPIPMSDSKANNYEKELEQTRYEIQERRNRRLAEESAKSFR